MIALVDYGLSNLRSVQKAFEHLGAPVTLTSDPAVTAQADKVVVPGVGAFAAGMAGLQARGLDAAVKAAALGGKPVLGICLGMQLLFDESQEMGWHAGLGLLAGQVARLAGPVKVPHVGWNQVRHSGGHALLRGVASGSYAYFVHSYICEPAEPGDVLATTDHGRPFAAIVARGSVFGIQFHPEKSQAVGQAILRNFAEM